MKTKMKIALGAIIVACLITTATATILLSIDVNNTGTILNAPGMELMLEDKTIMITTINWGSNIDPTSTITTFDIFAQDLILHNTGNVEWWFTWTKTALPSGLSLTCEYWNIEESTPRWQDFPENSWGKPDSCHAKPNGYTSKFRFTLAVLPTASAGVFSFTIIFKAGSSTLG